MNNLITKREMKALSGNWGSPTKIEKHIRTKKLIQIEEEETQKYKSKKKKKTTKKPYKFLCCPFCEKELPSIEDFESDSFFLKRREVICAYCKSFRVEECPACKNKTWYNQTTQIYKHQFLGCGFEGRKKI